jgi:hypothetical protein
MKTNLEDHVEVTVKETEICECNCHKENERHFGPWCDYTHSLYINKDGTINHNQYAEAVGYHRTGIKQPARNLGDE